MTLRSTMLEQLDQEAFDVLIIGGGINGASSAAALTARGARVALIDKQDFGGETSSNSSNLVWGGIKYLENGELGLVSELCRGRNELMKAYPSQIQEMRFLTSIQKGFRMPPFMVYLGALLYWGIGRFHTKAPEYLSRKKLKQRESVIESANLAGGFEYSDAWLVENDARFTFGFIRKALDNGAVIANYTAAESCSRSDDGWVTQVRNALDGSELTVKSRLVINAAGPYVDELNRVNGIQTPHQHLFSKGIHLIVERLTSVRRVMAFFASDGRLFFVIPMGDKTCIGTTDTRVDSPKTKVSEEDRKFVLDNANWLLNLPKPLTADDIISERCGVRPLVAERRPDEADMAPAGEEGDWLRMSRKHAIDVKKDEGYISIFGGKLTDCVNVGDEISALVKQLGIQLKEPESRWFGEADASLQCALTERIRELLARRTETDKDKELTDKEIESLSRRLWRRYGTAADQILDEAERQPNWLEPVMDGIDYCRGELHLMAEREMISHLADFFRRRTMLSLMHRKQDLVTRTGLFELCRILFGSEAEVRLAEFQSSSNPTGFGK